MKHLFIVCQDPSCSSLQTSGSGITVPSAQSALGRTPSLNIGFNVEKTRNTNVKQWHAKKRRKKKSPDSRTAPRPHRQTHRTRISIIIVELLLQITIISKNNAINIVIIVQSQKWMNAAPKQTVQNKEPSWLESNVHPAVQDCPKGVGLFFLYGPEADRPGRRKTS